MLSGYKFQSRSLIFTSPDSRPFITFSRLRTLGSCRFLKNVARSSGELTYSTLFFLLSSIAMFLQLLPISVSHGCWPTMMICAFSITTFFVYENILFGHKKEIGIKFQVTVCLDNSQYQGIVTLSPKLPLHRARLGGCVDLIENGFILLKKQSFAFFLQERDHHIKFGIFWIFSFNIPTKFLKEIATPDMGMIAIIIKFIYASAPFSENHFGKTILVWF